MRLNPFTAKLLVFSIHGKLPINKGSDDGVEIGMIFKILSTKGSEIEDPDTGEPLGSVDLVKTSVKVTVVQPANRCCINLPSPQGQCGRKRTQA